MRLCTQKMNDQNRFRADGQVGMAPGCNPGDRRFDPGSALQVVSPTQGTRIGTYYPAPG